MDPVQSAPPAPAPEASVEEIPALVTVSADIDAAQRGDFETMQRAVRAQRSGKPLDRVTRDDGEIAPAAHTTAAAAVPPDSKPVSKRQQQINDYERRIAEQSQRIAALEQRAPAPVERQPPTAAAAAPAPAPVPAKETPAYKRLAALPNAPKLTDVDAAGQPVYESVEEHSAAMAIFVADQREAEAQQSRTFEAQRARFDEQANSFNGRLAAAAKADPTFTTKIAPQLLAPEGSVPLVALPRGARATFANVVAQAVWDGADPVRLLPHLHADGDKAANAIAALPPDQWLTELHRLDGRLAAGATSPAPPAAVPAAQAAPRPSTISAAPPPAPKVTGAGSTTHPADTALARGDVGFFVRQVQEKRAAGRRSA